MVLVRFNFPIFCEGTNREFIFHLHVKYPFDPKISGLPVDFTGDFHQSADPNLKSKNWRWKIAPCSDQALLWCQLDTAFFSRDGDELWSALTDLRRAGWLCTDLTEVESIQIGRFLDLEEAAAA